MKALKKQKLIYLVVASLVISSVLVAPKVVSSLSIACQNSPECLAAIEREKEATAKADAAQATADEYQQKVNQLGVEIASLNAEIAESEAYAKELQKQIEETEAKLKEQQEALADLLVQVHFDEKTEPITLLAGTKTLSDFAEKQARNNTIKTQISLSAQKIKKTKEQLEEDKAKVQAIIESQKVMKEAVAKHQAEQQQLVSKYQGDAAAYSEDAKAARAAQQAAMEEYARQHPEIYGDGSMVYFGENTYRWQADCPHSQDMYATAINGAYIGGYVCECVSYVGWKAWEQYGLYLNWGNANTWDDVGRSRGIVDHTPAANIIAQTDAGGYGHVVWVEEVRSDGSIRITEYNNAYSSESRSWGDFGARIIPAYQVGNYNFIHVDRL